MQQPNFVFSTYNELQQLLAIASNPSAIMPTFSLLRNFAIEPI
ncbi:hypothetical protein ABEX53_32690 [Bacillus toyonensis]|nr:hypothetical protein [Bacillus toyonensis]MED3539240.1 hypothetical protein [Bacillus toyonensis]